MQQDLVLECTKLLYDFHVATPVLHRFSHFRVLWKLYLAVFVCTVFFFFPRFLVCLFISSSNTVKRTFAFILPSCISKAIIFKLFSTFSICLVIFFFLSLLSLYYSLNSTSMWNMKVTKYWSFIFFIQQILQMFEFNC